MDIKGMLMKNARARGICFDGYLTMKECPDVNDLISYYIRGINWCLENDYPTLQFIRDNFSDIEKRGIYVDRKFRNNLFSKLQVYVFHNCSGTIRVELNRQDAIIPMLYFANNCHIKVICKQNQGVGVPPIRVPLYIFGDNVITAEDNENAIFKKYQMDVL